ncbi:DNA polymerase zeta catalytic subunit isoform X2 [Pseudomyrmex gracilis]|uniref:DNA polymerase zeta catalytic subunit isoform X2 n=1 Tax=Pseudomyrmex gracilis TaxID=219809 RepID=UPI000995D6DB|nr:DNA polymerase zeta catalytic subunit isoform X2 [Pseudomyrmex gracilis]
MFSITLVNIDTYQASPIPELDVTFSEFRGSEIKKVPVIRIFGSTATGKKACLHIHGVFPYIYVPCTVEENMDSYAYQLAASIDSALNTSFGSTLSTNQHVYKVQRVSGIPFYGYHEKKHLFFKIYFYNSAIIKRTADLLQNGAILNQVLQPYEAHIPYILQFMIDYNLYGMNLINLNNIKYRQSLQVCTMENSQNKSSIDLLDSQMFLPISVTKQSMCELEVDAHASEILNRQGINEKLTLNPGLAAIWNEEKIRRAEAGLENTKSQLLYPESFDKILLPTSNDIYQKNKLLKRLHDISQSNETVVSNTIESSYPIEAGVNEDVLNASHILNHNESFALEQTLERTCSENRTLLQIASSAVLDVTRSQSNMTDTSSLDANDMQLVEMLANLAEKNETVSNVDDDSVLGSQYSIFSEPAKNEEEEEDDVEDLNITSLDLDLSSWESECKRSNQHDSTIEAVRDKQNTELDELNVIEEDNDITLTNISQFDGADDLYTKFLEHDRETIKYSNSKADITASYTSQRLPIRNKYSAFIIDATKKCDHQDLDVFDLNEIDTREHINDECHVLEYKDKYSCKQNSKSYFQNRIVNSNHHSPNKLVNFKKLIVSSVDGATATDSSDSESEIDVTVNKQETRICEYKSGKKTAAQDRIQVTPKRKRNFKNDDYKSPDKRSNIVQTPKRQYSLGKELKSPQALGSYSPLNITITSPKTAKSPIRQCESPKQYVSISNAPSTSTTPKRKIHTLRVKLLRDKRATNLLQNYDLDNINTDNISGELVDEIDTIQITDSASTVKASEITAIQRDHKQRTKNNETSSVRRKPEEVRKRLSFLNNDDVESTTFAESDRRSENLIVPGRSIDQIHADATIFSFSNEEGDDGVPSSQRSEKSNDTLSPERNYASCIRNSTKRSMKFHDVIPETDVDEDEEDAYNTTFSQHISKKIENNSQNFLLERSIHQLNRLITITTMCEPPSYDRIVETMSLYGIPKCRSQKPFFSNKLDLVKQKEFSNKNAPNFDVPAFKSSLDEITSIKLWRRMKVNEFYPSGASIKTGHIKKALAGYNLITIKPLMEPPSPTNVKNWLRAKKYLSKENHKTKSHKQDKKSPLNVQNVQCTSINVVAKERKPLPETSSNNLMRRSDSLMLDQSMLSEISNETKQYEFTQNNTSQLSKNSLNPSLRKALENPLLYTENKTHQPLGISYGQIECLSKESYGSNISNENLQKARAITVHQYLTLLSLEVHAVTREDLIPDPQYDSIAALFYAVYSDISTDTDKQIEHGVIIVNSNPVSARLNKIHSASAMCPILYVATEWDVLDNLVKLIELHNPDILLGWEVEALSWGYVFQRALHLRINNFPLKISKVPHMQIPSKFDAHTIEKDDLGEIKVPGRNILDVWRIMRHEAALLTYTFENVMHHVLHERIPCPSFKALSTWWKHESIIIKSRVIHHYVIRVVGTLKLLNHLDIIGRTCEHARLFGIQFYEVFSRGSQFRVESMMLRLAKPMNYIPISPSIHQRAKMRAPECLPLIMEPESEFYTDPLIVLDFQSLYPSMIIAYNYCFSTCLGRIEHIGQYEPFEFGAATLRIKKNTALKLQEKMNFSPCGVAFVKKEVCQGILPRMLTEILNTRLMVKESMKLHPAENRTLQRILHSQQLGLKLIANVTYGYTSANFSGRMPCIEIGDSVVSKGRETLERAIKLVESTSKWGGRVVYGDTDSIFVLLPGKSREEAFIIGEEIADAVTAMNPPPVKLKFEKVLYPSILQTKKRYCGYMYETRDQEKPEFLAKGIETVRRDGCPAVAKILEKALKILFDTKDISLVKLYITKQFDKIFRRQVSIQDLTFAKEFRGMRGYKPNACVPALELTRRLIKKDPRAIPRNSERVRYIIVAGAPNQALIHCVRTPIEVITDPALAPNSVYYITKVIIPPLNRCFNLFGIDINTWYKEMPHRSNFDTMVHIGENNPKSTIRQFFSSVSCLTCGEQASKEICSDCLSQSTRTILVLLEKIKQFETTYQQIASICHSCTGRLSNIECISLDCPVLYRMFQARKELAQVSCINNIIYGNNSIGIKKLSAVADWY